MEMGARTVPLLLRGLPVFKAFFLKVYNFKSEHSEPILMIKNEVTKYT